MAAQVLNIYNDGNCTANLNYDDQTLVIASVALTAQNVDGDNVPYQMICALADSGNGLNQTVDLSANSDGSQTSQVIDLTALDPPSLFPSQTITTKKGTFLDWTSTTFQWACY
jgi:hypothetical protein